MLHLARSWLEQRLVEQGLSIEQLVHLESQNQAADQVSVSHSIASLRFLSAMDWKEFVETLSLVEETLRSDPAGVYSEMDFSTRDRYRHSVEAISRHSQLSEAEVAQKAVQLAADGARQKGREDRTAHVGFYLIDKGQSMLGRMANVRWPWRTIIERSIHRFPLTFYAGGIGALTLLATFGFMQQAQTLEVQGWKLIFFTLVFLLCASQLAVALMNWLSTLLVKPRLLPRLDYSSGIAPDCRTMVVVPTMLTSLEGVDRLIETLEIHHLANRDQHLHFALLTDFRDAPEEILPGDQVLLQRARAGVEMLNQKYPSDEPDSFLSCFIARAAGTPAKACGWVTNASAGKLTEFNALLRGGSRECFSEIVGETAILPAIKYVITLDTDTQLPRDAARQLVGTMAHPLNRPVFDAGARDCHRRLQHSATARRRESAERPALLVRPAFCRRRGHRSLHAGSVRRVSGCFPGRLVYRKRNLRCGRLRASHARTLPGEYRAQPRFAGSVSCPLRPRERRGILRGISFPLQRGHRPASPLDSRRLADHAMAAAAGSRFGRPAHCQSAFRAVAVEDFRQPAAQPRPGCPDALAAGRIGCSFPELGGLGSLLVLAIITLPGLLAALVNVFRKPADLPWAMHLRGVAGSGGRQLGQIFLTLAFLPYDAFISLDAIGRTLLRLLVTRKRLLEWQTSSDSERTTRADLAGFYATMWIAPVVALATGFSGSRHAAGSTASGPADPWPLAGRAVDRLVDQPAHRTAGAGFDGGAIDLSATHRPQDVAFF